MTTTDFWGLEHEQPRSDTGGEFYERLRDGTSREIIYDHASYPSARVPLNNGKTLPTSPFVGQSFAYEADRATGVSWHLCYLPDGSAYPWRYLGGPPLFARVNTDEATASVTYVDLATVGPDIPFPLAGEYLVAWGTEDYQSTLGAPPNNFTGLHTGNATVGFTLAADILTSHTVVNAANTGTSPREFSPVVGIVGQSARVRYLVGAGTGQFRKRWLRLTPIRVKT